MKIGFIISFYDEIEIVEKNVSFLKREKCPLVIIQSKPKEQSKILKEENVDFYELLPDMAGSREEFRDIKDAILDEDKTTVKPLSRNFGLAFQKASAIDVDWWVTILGDIKIKNLQGIKKIIQKMEKHAKTLGVTRAVGQTFLDSKKNHTRIQQKDTHDFMPQFFLTKGDLVKKGIFQNIDITNYYTFEQCMGDAATRFFRKNNVDFWQECYSICDYAYPKFIEGVEYNPDRAVLPRYVDSVLNAFRRLKVR